MGSWRRFWEIPDFLGLNLQEVLSRNTGFPLRCLITRWFGFATQNPQDPNFGGFEPQPKDLTPKCWRIPGNQMVRLDFWASVCKKGMCVCVTYKIDLSRSKKYSGPVSPAPTWTELKFSICRRSVFGRWNIFWPGPPNSLRTTSAARTFRDFVLKAPIFRVAWKTSFCVSLGI